MDAKELLEQVTVDVVIEIMEENGSPVYSRSVDGRTQQEVLWFKTICHGGDSAKLAFYTGTKDFYCYTSCGRMPFFEFIKRIRGYSNEEFYLCLQYVAEKVGFTITHDREGLQDSEVVKRMKKNISEDKTAYEKKKEREERLNNAPSITKFYDDTILNYFDKDTFYQGWIDEGISIETMQKYGISYYWLEHHIIIPHFNQDNQLVGIRRRSLKPEDARNKYMPVILEGLTYGHPLGLNLYGLNHNKEAIARTKTAVIVEGEKSVLLSDTYYGKDSVAVATCGFNISNWQIDALRRLQVEKVYLGFDKDFDTSHSSELDYMQDEALWKDYSNYRQRLKTLGKRLQSDFQVFMITDEDGKLGKKDSPMDKGKATFEYLKEHAKLIKYEAEDIVKK